MQAEINSVDVYNSNDIDKLEKNIEAFPYSAYTRYLLLSHYKKNEHSDFEKAAKKTALYFNNIHWFQFQLSQLENEANDVYAVTNHFAVLTEEQIENVKSNSIEEEQEDSHALTNHETTATDLSEENLSEQKKFDGNQPQESDVNENNPEIINQSEVLISEDDQDEEEHGTIIEADYIHAFENKNDVQNSFHNSQSIQTVDENLHDEKENHYEENIKEPTESTVNLKEAPESISTTEDVIAFEPLHTVDYFASQGIKIPEEALTNDKLGNQMKSFTEWLRSMKKLHPGKLPQHNSLAENIIQSAAETSNINTEVLTEAMAEVLIKQDKREKAIEMYNKLSLINPSKSAYFAAKIENIKST